MVYRYVPILRWKQGEREAVRQLSGLGRTDVTPLFILAPDQFVGKKATSKAPALPSPALFAQQAQTAWGTQPFMLDAMALATTATGHPLIAIGAAARALGLALIPSTSLFAPAMYQAAVGALVAADGRGVALRIDLQELANSAAWIAAWPYAPADTDLVIDLGATVGVAHSLGAALDPTFHGLVSGPNWRSVTIAGSSMPANFTGVAAGLSTIPRTEAALWNRLAAVSLPYRLDFGDYATVSTVPAPSGIAWGFPINVKYTLANDFLICRGVRTKGLGAVNMDTQLTGHAVSVAGYGARHSLPHSWADTRIDQIAAGAAPGGLPGWVSLSVNRHIERTRASLP